MDKVRLCGWIGWMCECGNKLDEQLHCVACERRFAQSGPGLKTL